MPYIGNPIYQSAFVTDQFSGTGSQTAYTMSVAPAGTSNVLVVVSGVVQDPATYGVVGNTLTFSGAPPSGTGNISCRYLGVPVTGIVTTAYRTVTEFTATASQTTFTPPSYTVGFINVYRNGVLLGSADYTATNGTTVVLTTGASAGNLLTVESFLVSSVLNAIPNTAGAVSSSNIVSGVTLTTPTIIGQATIPTINLTSGQIAFPATQVPSADANTLDDYEEGTFTPTVTGGLVYSQQVGKYTKIGNVVTFIIVVSATRTASATPFAFSGLPFAAANVTTAYTSTAIFPVQGFNKTGATSYATQILPNGNFVNIYGVQTNSSLNYLAMSMNDTGPTVEVEIAGSFLTS